MVLDVKKLILASLVVTLTLALVAGHSLYQTKSTHIIIEGVLLAVDLAETPATQEKGLSGRSSMPSDHGMLFIFSDEDYWGFWMRDMRFPLDIIWFNSNRQAVFIESNLPPCSAQNCPIYTPTARARYVLEVNAGFVATQKITIGSTFTFLGL
jgi:hypothetical protein